MAAKVQPVPPWVTGSLPQGFLERDVAPQEEKWARPPLGMTRSVRQPGIQEEEMLALAPLRATIASVPRSRMIEYKLATMSAEAAVAEQAAMREAQSPQRWDGGTALGYTRVNLPLQRGVWKPEDDSRFGVVGGERGEEEPPGRPDASPPGRSRPKPKKKMKNPEQVALGFTRPDEEPLQKPILGGNTVVTYSVHNHAQVLPQVRTDGSEISPSDPRPFADTETEEEKRARVLRASSRTWLRTDKSAADMESGDGVGAVSAAPVETAEHKDRKVKAAQRQEQEGAARAVAVTSLLHLLGVDGTPEPADAMGAACLFATRVEANVERSYNAGTRYEGRLADKATLWRVLRDYLQEERFEVDEEGKISPVDLRRGFVQLGLVPTDDVFAHFITLCRQIADPEFDPVTSDQPIWLWEMRDMADRTDVDSTVSLEHVAGAIRQLAALGEPGDRKVTTFPRSENAAVAAQFIWHDEEGSFSVCKTDTISRQQSSSYKQWRPLFVGVICMHLLLGLWEDRAFGDYCTAFYLIEGAGLACVAVHALDCAITARLSASWTSDTALVARVVLTALMLADTLMCIVAAMAGADAAHYALALRPALAVLHPGAYSLRRELSRVLSLLSATKELAVLTIVVLGVFASYALTQAPDLLVLAPGCLPTDTDQVLVMFCGGYTAATLLIWGLAIAATLMHCEQLRDKGKMREEERRWVVVNAAFTVLDLDASGTISDDTFTRYAQHMASGEADVSLSDARVRHIWETLVPDSTSATAAQFLELNSALVLELSDHPPLWCTAHASCIMPRVPEPCLERVAECDILEPAFGGDLTEPFQPEPVIIAKFEHTWELSRLANETAKDLSDVHSSDVEQQKPQSDTAVVLAAFANYSKLAPKAKKKKKQKLPKVVVNPKNVPKWQAAQDVLDRGKKGPAARIDGVQRQLFYLNIPGRLNPTLVWEPADAVLDHRTGRATAPYRAVQNHGVVIARALVFKTFSADEFSDPASRLLDVECEYGPRGPKTQCGRVTVGGLGPELRRHVIKAWQWCVGECAVLLALLLLPAGSTNVGAIVFKVLCAIVLLAEATVTVLAIGAAGYWHTALHRRHGVTTTCFLASLAFDLSGFPAADRPFFGGLATVAHLVAASRLLGFMRLLRPRRAEHATASTMRLVSTVVAQCAVPLAAHAALLVLLLYSSAAAFDTGDDGTTVITAGGNATIIAESTMAGRLVSEAFIVLGGGQGAADLRDGSVARTVWLAILLWVARVLLLGSGIGHVLACWQLESSRYLATASHFERQNRLVTDPLGGRPVLRQFDLQMMPLRKQLTVVSKQWFQLLTTPHEWPLKAKLTGTPSAPEVDRFGIAFTGCPPPPARRGFDPIWSCRACVAVYMAKELQYMERDKGEPSEEETARRKTREESEDKTVGEEKKEAAEPVRLNSALRKELELEPEPEPEPKMV